MAKPANSPKDRRHPAIPWDSLFISVNSATTQLLGLIGEMVGRKLTYGKGKVDDSVIYVLTSITNIQYQNPIEATKGSS